MWLEHPGPTARSHAPARPGSIQGGFMRKLTMTLFAILALALATGTFAQVRGRGHLQGTVVDKNTGKPIANATVTISGQSTQPIVVKTSSGGRWAAIGMTSGSWNIDI